MSGLRIGSAPLATLRTSATPENEAIARVSQTLRDDFERHSMPGDPHRGFLQIYSTVTDLALPGNGIEFKQPAWVGLLVDQFLSLYRTQLVYDEQRRPLPDGTLMPPRPDDPAVPPEVVTPHWGSVWSIADDARASASARAFASVIAHIAGDLPVATADVMAQIESPQAVEEFERDFTEINKRSMAPSMGRSSC